MWWQTTKVSVEGKRKMHVRCWGMRKLTLCGTLWKVRMCGIIGWVNRVTEKIIISVLSVNSLILFWFFLFSWCFFCVVCLALDVTGSTAFSFSLWSDLWIVNIFCFLLYIFLLTVFIVRLFAVCIHVKIKCEMFCLNLNIFNCLCFSPT